MTGLTPIIAVFLLQIVVLLPEPSSAAYELNVRLFTYENKYHRDSSGDCCDYFTIRPKWCRDDCDNIFTFCLRGANVRDDNADNCPLGRDSFRNYHDNIINFSRDSSYRFFSQDSWPAEWDVDFMQGSALLYVRIVDYDLYNGDDHVDNIYIPIHLSPGQSIRQSEFEGDYRRSKLELSIQLHCQPDFYGEDCLTNCVPTDDDTGHFGCGSQGERLCLPGWRDPANHCLTPICEECNPIGGRCTAPRICTCLSGWEGPQCTQCLRTSPGCSTEGGFCIRPDECRCHDGYGGDNCEVYLFPCEHEPCQNGATCDNDDSGGYTCQCSSGYGGRNCTVQCESGNDICTVECNNLTNPCENGGSCQINTLGDGVSRSSCTCRQGFSGEYCEINVNGCLPNPCRNGGTCQDLESSNYLCSCLDGWAGHDCDEERDECEEFKPCKNGATCTDLFGDYKCDCVPGYMGHDCEQEINECSPSSCKNGNCTDLFNDYTCQCFNEFTGVNCETDLNSCRSSPCHNEGTCENEPEGFYSCTCPPGYTGFNCERIDNCLSLPCNNQGTCVSTTDNYYCICNPGLSGKNCVTVLNQSVPKEKGHGIGTGVIVGGVVGGVFSLFVIVTLVIVAVLVLVYLLKISRANNYNMKANISYVKATGQDTEYYSNFDDIKMTTNDGYGLLSASTHYYEVIREN